MSFTIITDTSANLPTPQLKKENISVIPLSYSINSKEYTSPDTEAFEYKGYYESMRKGVRITTSQINPQQYIDYMEPLLKTGEDILFVGMSSGISGSYHSAEIAAEQFRKEYPQRTIRLVDSLGASLGEGFLVLKAIECKNQGMSLDKTADFLMKFRKRIYQVFTVDDLMYLRRGGRLSNITAIAGMILNIKPLLKGNEIGKIVSFGKARGRKNIIEVMAKKYEDLALASENQLVGISHANCPEDAKLLAKMLKRIRPIKKIMIVQHEPVTGSYLGPNALALYFEGGDDVRLK